MSKKTRSAIAVIVVLVLAGAVATYAITSSNVTAVRTGAVTQEDLAVTVAASGRVEASSKVDVYPPTAGTLVSVAIEDGDEVSAGDILAVMDTAPIEIQVAQAQMAYKGAIAQRNAITSSAPGAADLRAAQAGVDAAYSAYLVADAAYQAALSGVGGPTPADVAEAQVLVAVFTAAGEAAQAAYDTFYNGVYLPTPEPRDPSLESTLATLALTRDLAAAELANANAALAALQSGAGDVATVRAKLARDQANAAYLGAVSQRDALAKASNVSAALASANAAVSAAEAALDFANQTLARAEIIAPSGGVVLFGGAATMLGGSGLSALSSSGGLEGSALSAGSSVSPAAPVFTIVSFEDLAFSALVDETDIARVETGMSAAIALDALAGSEFTATVGGIGREARVTSTGGTAFPVSFTFDPAGKLVLLGMNGSVEIEVEMLGRAITMPVEALLEDEGVSYAFTVKNGKAHRVELEVGRMTETRVQVLSGLSAGDTVIVSGVAELADGDRVRAE